jgi:class 3 adenylate cyclase
VNAERRQVTVLFVDMVGFTAFSERAGEEAAFKLMQELAKLMEDAVREQDGVVQAFTGDGIMAVFGAPVAHEDAPLRACRAALSILEKLAAEDADFRAEHGVRPQLRIGLNSGPAVVGKVQGGADATLTVLGDTVNVAARLQAVAVPGSAAMSEAAYRLVEGLVEASLVGAHRIKGKSDPQKTYQLIAIREQASRFDATIQRGLTRYVGREWELEELERHFGAAGGDVRVVDIVGEPGIGKSRLVHEFVGRIDRTSTQILIGGCAPDGWQEPFRPFIEIVRKAFALSPNDSDAVVLRKLEEGLQALSLGGPENLGLLLDLLGLEPPVGALAGFDGALIGLRTRDLLQQVMRAFSRTMPWVMVLEDLHWLDTASEELLEKIVAIEDPLQVLIVQTRRPEYAPPWAGRSNVTRMLLDSLSGREITRLAAAKLGIDELPDAAAQLIAAKTGGNPLFVEEVTTFLVQSGFIRRSGADLDFDLPAASKLLPDTVQSLLGSRVDRLSLFDRNLLQTASVVGRRFDPDLVAAVSTANEAAEVALSAAETLDLIHRVEGSNDYEFKHALVRDALYDRLLTNQRAALHLKVAENLERRLQDRATESAEVLAHHYSATARADKAFAYLVMAGDKSLDVYAIPEAEDYYRRALLLVKSKAELAGRTERAHAVVRLLETLAAKNAYLEVGATADEFMPILKQSGDTPELVIAHYFQALSLLARLELRQAHAVMLDAHAISQRLNDGRAKAYALAGLLYTSSYLGLDSAESANRMKAELLDDCERYGDPYIRNWGYFFTAWDSAWRGSVREAHDIALRLIETGEKWRDPRAIGQATLMMGIINLLYDDASAAREYAERCVQTSVTVNERLCAELVKASAALLLGQARDQLETIETINARFERRGALFMVQRETVGAALALMGRISEGVAFIKRQIAESDRVGDQSRAAFSRIMLAEIYIQILSGGEKPPLSVILKNLPILAATMAFGSGRAERLLRQAEATSMLSEGGIQIARIHFNLGVLSARKRRISEAKQHFEKARAGSQNQGADKLLRRIDAALAALPWAGKRVAASKSVR